MALSEFDIIEDIFRHRGVRREDVVLGIGDDAAVLNVPDGSELLSCVDTLVAGVHFPHDHAPADIGYRALAVNLSDMAAMGAEPSWALLALTLPEASRDWLEAFSEGLFELAREYRVSLVGGDVTRGPLTISMHLHGLVPAGCALTRAGARPGDAVFVTGTLGSAAAALRYRHDASWEALWGAFSRPQPRIRAGIALRPVATACIDVSDGFGADLGHILTASDCGATVQLERLPVHGLLRERLSAGEAAALALSGGDDYELCFTVAGHHAQAIDQAALGCPVRRVGRVEQRPGLRLEDTSGAITTFERGGYRHF